MRVRSRDGFVLEAELERAEAAKATLILCHPHPRSGGTMNAPLLLALRDELLVRNWNVLRFNFRGVGSSEGEMATGTDELQDVLGVIEEAQRLNRPIALAGWSFGGSVALRITREVDGLLGCVAIAPGIEAHPDYTDGVPDDVSPRCPVLIVIGHNDEQVSVPRAREWAERHGAAFEEVRGANHFFWAKYEAVTELVCDWLDERIT